MCSKTSKACSISLFMGMRGWRRHFSAGIILGGGLRVFGSAAAGGPRSYVWRGVSLAAAAAGAGRLRGGLELLCLLRCSLGRAAAPGGRVAAARVLKFLGVSLAASARRTKSVG